MNNDTLDHGLDVDDKLKVFIIDFLISENKSLNYITETLKRYGLTVRNSSSILEDFINQYFSLAWDSQNKSWIHFSGLRLNLDAPRDIRKFIDLIHNKDKLLSYNDYVPYKSIRIPVGIEIPEIGMLETAVSILTEEKDVNLNGNDAATLLKKISTIESKLNEIARAINKISKIITGNHT